MKTTTLLVSLLTPTLLWAQRTVTSLNDGWEFARDSLFTQVEHINVPHDFQISQPWVPPTADERADNSDAAANTKSRLSARGFKEMGTGWYRRLLSIEPQENERYLLDFEGIMLVGDVYLNGQRIGGTDYGYVGFELDVTDRLLAGDNELVVKASTMTEKNSRWYTGGGLFRNVSLVTTPRDLYFARHPLYITTRDNRYVNITAEVCYRAKMKDTYIDTRLYAPDGRLIHQQTDTAWRSTPARTFEVKLQEMAVADARLWDTEHPNLYRVVTTLRRSDGSVADEVTDEFGIRTIETGPDYGLKLNGQKVLLKGYANHHTLGALGAAAYPRAIEKRLQLMKQFGMNHVRTSHNPYSRDFIRLCDRLGLLVVDELYDKWTRQHSGGRVPFMNHWAQDVEEWVRRDRNSPSVVMWSLGNELQQDPNQPFGDFGVTCYRMMRPVVQRYDATRKVTVAMHPRYRNWQTDSLPCDLAMLTDVQAYNYRYMYFPGDGRRFPWMTFYQSEASTQAMGPNYFEMDLNRVIGLAYWGAIDYLGESMGWPAKGWAQGVFDIALEPKPKAYFMRSFFKPDEPLVHLAILESENAEMWNGVKMGNDRMSELWNRPEGSKANIYVYTNCDEVELRLNGHSLGRKANPADPKQRNQILWGEIDYQPGKLEAIGYNRAAKDGKPSKVASHTLETTGKAVRLVVESDNPSWQADGMDLQHVRITAVDSKGRRVLTATDQLTFSIEGDADIVAVSNGDIASDELNTTPHFDLSKKATAQRCLWQGSALVILRAGHQSSPVTLRTTCPGFKPVTTRLQTR